MSELLIDLGNTRLKWRLQHHGLVQSYGAMPTCSLSLEQLHACLPASFDALFLASVANREKNSLLETWLIEKQIPCNRFSTQASFKDLINAYRQPSLLGVDRWLAMVAARQLSQEAVCVVDCGSAITFDYIRADGRHEGGYIIPSAKLMVQALTRDTANINICAPKSNVASADIQFSPLPGTSTFDAVSFGCHKMALHGVRALIKEAQLNGYGILLCGGDGEKIANELGLTYIEGLVLNGIAEVAELDKH